MFISTGCYNLCYSLALHVSIEIVSQGLEQQTGWPQLPAIVWVIRIAVINMSFFSNNSFLFCIALSESPQTKWSLSSFWGNISNSQVDAGFLSLAAKSFTFLCSNWFQLWNLWGFFFCFLAITNVLGDTFQQQCHMFLCEVCQMSIMTTERNFTWHWWQTKHALIYIIPNIICFKVYGETFYTTVKVFHW